MVALRLDFQSATYDHDGFAGSVPVVRPGAVRSEAGKDNRWSLGGVPFLDCNCEASRGVWYWSKLGRGGRIHNRILCRLSSKVDRTKREYKGEKQRRFQS